MLNTIWEVSFSACCLCGFGRTNQALFSPRFAREQATGGLKEGSNRKQTFVIWCHGHIMYFDRSQVEHVELLV